MSSDSDNDSGVVKTDKRRWRIPGEESEDRDEREEEKQQGE